MRFYYGEQNILRALDEAEFWKHQEAEHAGMVPVVTPGLEAQYVQRLEQFGSELSTMHAEVVKYTESATRSRGIVSRVMRAQMLELVKRCIDQSEAFTQLLEELLQNSHAVRSNNASQVVIHHQIRESKYFIGIDQLILF
jgi:hypothetical protein